jgi:hypothetical protein
METSKINDNTMEVTIPSKSIYVYADLIERKKNYLYDIECLNVITIKKLAEINEKIKEIDILLIECAKLGITS